MTGRGRGFASMSPDKRQEAARAGAAALREYGLSHQWTRAQAREAGERGRATQRARTQRRAQERPA